MIDIIFVILNYNIITETVNCVKSIINNIDTEKYKIIVVDNGSKEGVLDEIKQNIQEKGNVEYIQLSDNIGFARGNNKGIEAARKYNPRFVCCINNDTLFIQNNFYKTLCYEQEKKEADVIGPKVYLQDNSIQSFNKTLCSIKEYEEQLKAYKQALLETPRNRIKSWLKDNKVMFSFYKKIVNKKEQFKDNEEMEKDERNIMLHGSCIIFTDKYLRKFEGFDPRTFLYREEELLYLRIKSANMTSHYCPSLYIKHLEDASTQTISKKRSERDKFYYNCQIQSIEVLINELKQSISE